MDKQHINVVFTFTDRNAALEFLSEQTERGWTGIAVDADTGEPIEEDV